MSQRRKLIAGNWKMNGQRADGIARANGLAARMRAAGQVPFDMLVCPPATILAFVGDAIAGSGIDLGGQDCHAADAGAHTGDIGAGMLADLGCRFVIVGHSERRQNHREVDDIVAAKAAAANRNGLISIICIGETEAEREAGNALDVVSRQLAGSIPHGASAGNTVIAYEPVWAIGTGKTATPDDVAEMHAHIRKEAEGKIEDASAVRILYGGSVKPGNASELMALADVDGALVGGASLDVDDFWAIAESCR